MELLLRMEGELGLCQGGASMYISPKTLEESLVYK
jgi:hypothetical protein